MLIVAGREGGLRLFGRGGDRRRLIGAADIRGDQMNQLLLVGIRIMGEPWQVVRLSEIGPAGGSPGDYFILGRIEGQS